MPLSGLVVISDGADNSQTTLSDSLRALEADSVPVFTVGLGREEFARDIQLSRVETPRSVLKGTSLVVDVVIAQVGYTGTTVMLQVEDEGRIVSTQEVMLPSNGDPATARVHFTATEPGPRIFRFRCLPQPGEMVTQNNARDVLVTVEDRTEKILYFEGEPRFEVKFLRRAVADDDNLQVVVLQRTAENKYLRLDVDDADDLLGGFPKTREELFQYRGLILGSVEASYFTPDQLRMIADFVNQRGGGFLMLGGRHAFAEGGYAGTPVADILPVTIARASCTVDGEPVFTELTVALTRAGATHAGHTGRRHRGGVRRSAGTGAPGHFEPQPDLPTSKPGATTLLHRHSARLASEERVVLAFQRYGAGKTLASADPGFLDVADARRHRAGRPDARVLLAAPAAVAGRRRARSRWSTTVRRRPGRA